MRTYVLKYVTPEGVAHHAVHSEEPYIRDGFMQFDAPEGDPDLEPTCVALIPVANIISVLALDASRETND